MRVVAFRGRTVVAARGRDVAGGGKLLLRQARHRTIERAEVVDKSLRQLAARVLGRVDGQQRGIAVLARGNEAVGNDDVGGARVNRRPLRFRALLAFWGLR